MGAADPRARHWRMPSELQRRLGLALFTALAFATATGLVLMPAFDPVAGLRPRLGAAGAGALLVALAAAGSQLTLRQLGRRVHPRWGGQGWRALAWLGWAAAVAAWLLPQAAHGVTTPATAPAAADGRALLWLALAPLWLAAAGLWGGRGGRASARGAVRGPLGAPPQRLPHGGPGRGVLDHLDVGRGLDVQRPGAGQARVRRREDDVVAMAPEAEEPFAA